MVAEIAVSWARVGILALLVAALGAYLYWVELPEAAREAEGTRVFPLEADDVTRVAIRFPDRTLELARTGEDWRLTAPLEADADDAQVKGVVASLTAAKIERTLEGGGSDLAPFGLGPDALRVELADAGGTTAVATIGRTTPIGAKTYVRSGEAGDVALTASNLRAAVDKQPADLRDKRLLDFADDAVTRVEIARPDGAPVVLDRKEPDAWTAAPGDHVADLTEVRSYLSSLRATRAVAFVDESPADLERYGLATPRLRISVSTGTDAPPAVLLVGGEYAEGESTRLYAKRDDRPNVVGLGEWSLRSLDKDVGAFRDKTVLGFDPERVGRFEIRRRGDEPLVFERGDTGWTLSGGDGAVDQATVTRYLTDLRELKGSSIVEEPAADPIGFGLGDPEVRVLLTDRDGAPIGEVVATKHEDGYYAMRVGAGVVYDLRDYVYARVNKARDAFAPLPPPAAPAS